MFRCLSMFRRFLWYGRNDWQVRWYVIYLQIRYWQGWEWPG